MKGKILKTKERKVKMRLRELMDRQGLNASELARRIGVSRQTVSYYLYHANYPALDIAVRIADALDVSLDELAGRRQSI